MRDDGPLMVPDSTGARFDPVDFRSVAKVPVLPLPAPGIGIAAIRTKECLLIRANVEMRWGGEGLGMNVGAVGSVRAGEDGQPREMLQADAFVSGVLVDDHQLRAFVWARRRDERDEFSFNLAEDEGGVGQVMAGDGRLCGLERAGQDHRIGKGGVGGSVGHEERG